LISPAGLYWTTGTTSPLSGRTSNTDDPNHQNIQARGHRAAVIRGVDPRSCVYQAMSLRFWPVIIARGPHPFPSRTRSLSLAARMVLPGRPGGRVRRRRPILRECPDRCLQGRGSGHFCWNTCLRSSSVRIARQSEGRFGGRGRSWRYVFAIHAVAQLIRHGSLLFTQSRGCARVASWVVALRPVSGGACCASSFVTTDNTSRALRPDQPHPVRCSNRKKELCTDQKASETGRRTAALLPCGSA
jgi:hypothetical protein